MNVLLTPSPAHYSAHMLPISSAMLSPSYLATDSTPNETAVRTLGMPGVNTIFANIYPARHLVVRLSATISKGGKLDVGSSGCAK